MNWLILWDFRWLLLEGLVRTLAFSSAGIAGSLLLGTAVAFGRLSGKPVLDLICGVYLEVVKNIPMTVKLFFLYFVVGLDVIEAGITALIIHQSGYIADIISAGVRSIPAAQMESGHSQGFSLAQTFRFIILPQVFVLVSPPLTSQFIEVVKNSAALMLIGIQDLTFQTQHIENETFRGFEAATAVTAIYLMIALIIALSMAALTRKFRIQ